MTLTVDDRELIERLGLHSSWRDSHGELNDAPNLAHDRLQSLLSDRDKLDAQNSLLRRCLLPVQMTLAQAECVDEPIPDDAVVLHFMGSGASDQVTAGEVRAALRSTDNG